MMKQRLLNDRRVRDAKPGVHSDGSGLYLQCTERGSKSWFLRYKRNGAERRMGLGSCSTYSLAEARERATEARKLIDAGQDPIEQRNSERAAERLELAKSLTFDEASKRYIEAMRNGWKNEVHAQQWENTLATYASPIIGNLPIQALDTNLVMQVLEPIWSTKPETASRVRGRIESVWNWCKTREYVGGENPARWRGHLSNLLPKKSKLERGRVKHLPALPHENLPAFMQALRQRDGLGPLALEFTILCAARTGEVIGASWNEFDLDDKRVWVVPAERMKVGVEHRVPLGGRALEILRKLPRDGGGPFQQSNMSMLSVLRRMGRSDITVHGFRSTFRDWAADCTNHPDPVVEAALAHSLDDKTVAAYKRTNLFERRRRLMADWEKYCVSDPAEMNNVVPLRA
jgi:integrase